MRGGLDDALQKLARRNELRRRASQQSAPAEAPALTELVESVAAFVGRHPELRVALAVEGLGTPTAVRVWYRDGQPQVRTEPLLDAPYAADDAAGWEDPPAHPAPEAVIPADVAWTTSEAATLPLRTPAAAPRSPAPGSPAPSSPAPSSPAIGSPAPGTPAPGSPAVGPGLDLPGRAPVDPAPEPAGLEPFGTGLTPPTVPLRRNDLVEERTVPLRRPPEPLVIPSSDQAAKRLAALLREDPSLLNGTPPQ